MPPTLQLYFSLFCFFLLHKIVDLTMHCLLKNSSPGHPSPSEISVYSPPPPHWPSMGLCEYFLEPHLTLDSCSASINYFLKQDNKLNMCNKFIIHTCTVYVPAGGITQLHTCNTCAVHTFYTHITCKLHALIMTMQMLLMRVMFTRSICM